MAHPFHEDLADLLKSVHDPMLEIRHDLHVHPELAFQEVYTTRVIEDRLVELGWELAPCPTSTGAIAVLRGERAGHRVMVRADIDALPITEEVDLSYRSRNEGVMHACGHDVHAASLLGVADLLARRRADLAGEFTLLFQPAEEALGGALAMIEGGVLETNPVDFLVGAHVTSLAPVGVVATRAGILMSEAAGFAVHLHGTGGHGAMASDSGNVVLALCHLTPRLAEVVTGLSYEGTSCACSAGVINAGLANNVVPRHAVLRGTLRTFVGDQQRQALARLRTMLDEVEVNFAVTCVLDVAQGTPAVTNDHHVVERVMKSARDVVGSRNVVTVPPVSPSDDVAEFLRRVPGCYLLIGGALPNGGSGMHHSPDFAIDDDACRVIAGVLAASAVELAQP